VEFIEHLDEVGILYCLASIFFYIAYLRLELISVVISVYCGLPLAIEIFLIYSPSQRYFPVVSKLLQGYYINICV
jgi:hypothetical protein